MKFCTGMRWDRSRNVIEGGVSLSSIDTFHDGDGRRIAAAYEVEEALGEEVREGHPALSNPRKRVVEIGRRGAAATYTEYDVSDELAERIRAVFR